MKKILLTLLATVGIVVLLPATSFAAPAKTQVVGEVTNAGSPVKNAKVTITCTSSNPSHLVTTKHRKTNASGIYSVNFNAGKCPVGSTVQVSASKGSMNGGNSGTVSSVTKKLNIALVNVSVPELGAIAAFGAASVAGVGFLVVRRRQLGATNA